MEIPLSDWGLEFAEALPEAIREAIHEARGEIGGSIRDEEYRKRLQDRFGDRWRVRSLVQRRSDEEGNRPSVPEPETIEVRDVIAVGRPGTRNRTRHINRKTVQVIRMRASVDGGGEGVDREMPVDVPKFRFGSQDDFEHPWHLAVWVPNDPDGPTVVINRDSPILQDAIRYHQDQYPDVFAEEIATIVLEAYGEIAVCKIAHSQKLSTRIPLQDLDQSYRSEAALTVALMGLLAEESLIAQRLGRLGRKRPAA